MVIVDVYQADSAIRFGYANIKLFLAGSEKAESKTSTTGIFFEGLAPAGNYSTSAVLSDTRPELVRLVSPAMPFTLVADDMKLVVYRTYAILQVRVVDASSRAPIATEVFNVNGTGLPTTATLHVVAEFLQLAGGRYSAIAVGLSGTQGDFYKAAAAIDGNVLAVGQVTVVDIPLAVRSLKLTALDDHFAPSVEDLDITYEIQNMEDQPVSVQISANGAVVHEIVLADPEKANGSHTVHWNGKGNKSGAPGDFFDPQRGPYEVVLVHPVTSRHTVLEDHERPFRILYYSLHLGPGEWLPRRDRRS